MLSVGLEPHVGVDETTGEEKQDLLSLDVNHQYKIRGPFRDTREIRMQINIGCRRLSFCDKLFITEYMYQSIQMLVIAEYFIKTLVAGARDNKNKCELFSSSSCTSVSHYLMSWDS